MPTYNNPQNPHEVNHKDELKHLLDDIITYLWAGAHWHQKAAQCSWLMAIRGYGRIHELMSEIDYEDMKHLRKLCTDKLKHIAVVDMDKVAHAEMWEMHDLGGFKSHFKTWDEREEKYMECINDAIYHARMVNIETYDKLACIATRVQNEVFRVGAWYDRHSLGGWAGDDIAYVSEKIHDHVEHGKINPIDPMDINVG